MAHFAKVEGGLVVDVIVADQDFIDALPDAASWIQTSYNTRHGVHYNQETWEPDGGTPLRKNYASVGYIYNALLDAFIPPKPYPSWVLDENICDWVAPVAKPDDGQLYRWDEPTLSWVVAE